MSEIIKRKKGQVLNSTERQLILNLLSYLKNKNVGKSTSETIREISKATGCSERTIYKIKKEASKGITVALNKTRLRKKENKNSRNFKYDSFVKSSIRMKIHNYFFHNNSPTLNKILCLVNKDPELPNFKRSTLHTLLKEIGFVYETNGKKSYLTESRRLIELRQIYLKEIRKYRAENRWIVYLGESTISLLKKDVKKSELECKSELLEARNYKSFQVPCKTSNPVFINTSELINGTTLVYTLESKSWPQVYNSENHGADERISTIQEIPNPNNNFFSTVLSVENNIGSSIQTAENTKACLPKGGRKHCQELRLMIMHAGNDQGFIEGAEFISVSKRKFQDVENYKHWFLEELLPKIPPSSVVVIDNNSSYHHLEKNFPDESWKKTVIKNWLLSEGINVEKLNKKKELLSVVNQIRPLHSINFQINEMAKKRGVIIISLPPFHYELNPLNLIWAQIKYYVKSNMRSFKIKRLKELIKEGFHLIPQVKWMNCVHHVRKTEDLLWSVESQRSLQDNNLTQQNI